MAKNEPKIVYIEPAEYFPKRLRKKYGLGEFAKRETDRVESELSRHGDGEGKEDE